MSSFIIKTHLSVSDMFIMDNNALAFNAPGIEQQPLLNYSDLLCLLGICGVVIGAPILLWYLGIPHYQPGMPFHTPGP